MNKINIIFIFLVLSFYNLNGQIDFQSKNGEGFNSVFQNFDSGEFYGTSNGILIIKTIENNDLILDFQGSYSELEIEKDEENVYDVSYKKYTGKTTSGKTEILYETYGLANSFGIKLYNEWYSLSMIDGACDLVIDGLEYSYVSEPKLEYLTIIISKEIELQNSYKNKVKRTIKLMPNSVIVFVINRN